MTIVSDKSYDVKNISCINVHFISDEVEIIKNSTDQIRIIEYMSIKPFDNQLARVSTDGPVLNIRVGVRVLFLAFSRVEIYVPKDYTGSLSVDTVSGRIWVGTDFKLNSTQISSVSGNIDMNDMTAGSITVKTASGSVKSNKSAAVKAENYIRIQTTAGGIDFNEICSKDIEISTVSGNIKLGKVDGGHLIKTSSGSIEVGSATTGGTYKTTSGAIKAGFSDLANNINITSTSGKTAVSLPKGDEFGFSAKSVSGNVDISLSGNVYFISRASHRAEGKTGDNPKYGVNIKTTAGSISINEN